MTTIWIDDGVAVVGVDGDRLDAAATPAFKQALDSGLSTDVRAVILDASGLAFVDSTGLGAIVGVMKRLPEGATLVIAGAQAPLKRLLQITSLDRLFRQFDSVEEARAALGN
ncbi:MAG TPA: STAS domain-containing protein [Sphingomicrobium sp.]|jgi:anti-sigma B factor antagonist